jgi:hypothetical protein
MKKANGFPFAFNVGQASCLTLTKLETGWKLVPRLIPVMLRLVRTFDGHAEIVGLFFGELGELHADFFQVQPRR